MPTASSASPTIRHTRSRSAPTSRVSAAPRAYRSFSISEPRTRRSTRRSVLPARDEHGFCIALDRNDESPVSDYFVSDISAKQGGERKMCELCYVDEAIKGKIIARNSEFHKAAKSPFGEDDEVGMLNLIDADS